MLSGYSFVSRSVCASIIMANIMLATVHTSFDIRHRLIRTETLTIY